MVQTGTVQQRYLRPLLWSILAAIIIYGSFVLASDLKFFWTSILRLGAVGWLAVLGLSLFNYGLRFARWQIYVTRFNVSISVGRSLAYYLSGFALTTTPGKAGEAVRSLYLKSHGVDYVDSLAAFFTERFLDVVAMVLLSLLAVFVIPDYRWAIALVAAVILFLLPIVHSKRFHEFLGRQFLRLPWDKLGSIGVRLLELLRAASDLLRSGPLYAGLALGIVAWGAEGVAFYIIADTLGVKMSIMSAIGIYGISVLVGAISFLPGGLGTTEAAMLLLLKLSGADTPTAIAATLICRLATLWFAVIIGGVVMAVLEFGASRTAVRS